MEGSAEDVLLKCINALELVGERCHSIKHLADGKIYCCLISILKNEEIVNEDLATLTPRLEGLFRDHFAGDLIVFEEAVAGNCVELTKLTLLLLYITLFTEAKLRSRLVNSASLDQATQAKFKYLLEAVQKRGSAVSSRFLHILCTEKLDIKNILQCHTPVSSGGVGSPCVYTTSPKSSTTSPLRELVQSPHFRLQEILNGKKFEVKRLQQQVMALEGEKQETALTLDAASHKITKLREEVGRLQARLHASQEQQDETQAQVVAGDSLRQQQVSQLAVECSQLRRENAALQQTVDKVIEEKDEVTAKNASLHQHLLLVRAEKDRIHEDILALNQAKYENECLIESQASDIEEMKSQLEELQQHLMENKENPSMSIEESFGNISPQHYSAIASPGSSGEENMAEAVVEKILGEHKEELRQLQHKHMTLQQDFDVAAAMRDQLLEQVATQEEERKNLAEEVRLKTDTLDSVMQELNAAKGTVTTVMKEKLNLVSNLQEKDKCIAELKDEIDKTRAQMSEEKAAFNNQIKMMEKDSQDVQMKMKSDIELMTGEYKREIEEKENVIIVLQKDKDNLLEIHAEEKCKLMKAVEEKTESLETLEQKYENLTNQYTAKKDKLENDLKCSQEFCSQLMKEYDEFKDNLNTEIAQQALSLQEKVQEMATLKENMESMKAVNVDFVRKSESEIQRLSVNLEAEKQCVIEQKKEIDALMDTKAKYSDTIERLRESIEELSKKDSEQKDDLAKMNEKHLMLQQQSEEIVQRHKSEVSGQKEKFTKQEEAYVTLLKEVETSKHKFEEEKLNFVTSLQEKDKCIAELKDEIDKTRAQISEEKAASDTQIRMMEMDSQDVQMKMKSNIELMTGEYKRGIAEKEDIIIAFQKDKDNLLEIHAEEKCKLMKAVEEKTESLEALKQKYENLTNQYTIEKDKLESDLKCSQESCSQLMKEYDGFKENLGADFAQQALNLQEKISEIAILKENMESMKAVNVDLVRKSESEIQRLSVSLEAEKQCSIELRKEIDTLMDTKTKYIENIETLRESNEELRKKITELKDDLAKMNEKYLMLQQQSEEVVQRHKSEVSGQEEKFTKQEEAHVALLKEVETSKHKFEEEKLNFVTILQEKDKCIAELKDEIDKTRAQISEEKTASDTQIKMMEMDSQDVQMKMKSDIELMTGEYKRGIEEKEDIIVALQKDKDNLLEIHAEEKCKLMKAVEEKTESLEALEQKYENLTNQYTIEKDKLESDLKCSQESCSQLMKEYDGFKDNLNREIAQQALSLQEKVQEMATLKENMESMKAVNVDLVRKSESEIQRLSVSLEAEKQCVIEQKKEIDSLMDTKAKHSDTIERLRESIEELSKKDSEQKDDLAKMNEKYLMLQEQSEEIVQRHKSEVSGQEEKCTKQEAAHVALLKEVETSKHKFEEEKLNFVSSLQEKDKCIAELKDEIDKTRAQISEEKAASDTQIRMMEIDSQDVQMKMKSNIELITGEYKREIEEKEDIIIALQKDKDNLLEIHAEERSKLMKAVEEKTESLETLEQKYENLTNQYTIEKDKLESNLENTQDILKEIEAKEIEKFRESLQELSEGFTKLKGCVTERDEKYLLVQQQTEGAVQHCRNESLRQECLRKQEECHLALVNELRNNKQFFEEEKSALVKSMREKEEVIMKLKEEINQLEGKMSEEKAVCQQQIDSNKQRLEQEILAMSSSTEDKFVNQRQAVSDLQKAQEQALGQLTETTNLLHQQETLVATLNQKLVESKAEAEKQHSHMQVLESRLIDKEQDLLACKEEVMRVEREAEKSLHSLKEELQATKEKLKLERGAADRIRMSYKTEVEKLTLQIEEWDREKKERDVVLKKYETAKKKLAETVSSLDEARTTNRHYQQQLSQHKEYIKKLEDNAQKEKEAENRLFEIESKYQPVKEKLHEHENTIKRLNNEKRSLEMQLKHAESQLREQKKIQKRESFWERDSQKLTRMSASDSQVQRTEARRPTTSSSSNEEYWGVNDSAEKLIPRKTSGSRGQSVPQSNMKDMVFRKPGSRAKTSSCIGEGGRQREVSAATHTKGRHDPPPPQPEIIISDASLGKSIPKSMHFRCDEEEEELFNNKYLHDMKVGKWHPDGDEQWRRLSELQRRNSLYPPHMRSAYPAEMQFRPLDDFEDDKLREGCAVEDRQLMNLTQATENLELDSPAFNLRKRKSPSDSTYSETSLDSSDGKRTRRLSTSYSRPGPPTPGRRFSRGDKENRRESSASELSLSLWQHHKKEGAHMVASRGSSPVSHQPQPESGRVTRRRQLQRMTSSSSVQSNSSSPARSPSVVSKKGMSTPHGRKGMTPSSLRKILAKGKSPWRKLESSEEVPGKPHQPRRILGYLNRTLKQRNN